VRFWRIEGRLQPVPDLDRGAIRVDEEDISLTWAEMALAQDDSAGALDRLHGQVNVCGINQPEADVDNATTTTSTTA